ncbi:hypothetical protein DL93DRAFT_2089342 [Clavulina sp. PMI_390]|nr:hypothetical protein DL93DRAFT_2089342 [Clavulina sp. PMI_390]
MLHTKEIYISDAVSENRVDLTGVEFPVLKEFWLGSSSVPRFRRSQLYCDSLHLVGLTSCPQDYVKFLKGFTGVESIEIAGCSLIDDGNGLAQLPPGDLLSFTVSHSAANDTIAALELLDLSEVVDLYLCCVLTSNVDDDLEDGDLILVMHFSDVDLYQNVAFLEITEWHNSLHTALGVILGSLETLPFPQLEQLHIATEEEKEVDDESQELLATVVLDILSYRGALNAQPLALQVPSCLRSIQAELAQATRALTWDECSCQKP